jgi:hypothetical protein
MLSRTGLGGFLVLLACVLTAGASSAAEDPTGADLLRRDTTGLYPIWENTGHIEKGGDIHVGTTGAQVGILDVAHVGVLPINFVYRAPNGYLKVALFASPRWRIAAQAGAFRLLDSASHALFSPMYSSRLDNTGFGVTLVPVSLSASVEVARWLEVHQTLTGLGVFAPGHLRTAVTPGYSVVAELNPHSRHGLSLHASEVGFWAHDMAIAGASYRYRNGWTELRLGYFYRFGKSGVQASPLVSLGVLL